MKNWARESKAASLTEAAGAILGVYLTGDIGLELVSYLKHLDITQTMDALAVSMVLAHKFQIFGMNDGEEVRKLRKFGHSLKRSAKPMDWKAILYG